MDIDAILSALTTSLGLGAAGSIIIFGLSVLVDDVLGVVGALKTKTFDRNKLGSFLDSQFGTTRAKIVAVAVLSSVITAVGASLLAGQTASQIAVAAESVALSVAIAGSISQFAAVVGDIKEKVLALIK